MPDISYLDFGGLNSQLGFNDTKILYFNDSVNADIFQGAVRRARGQELKLTLPSKVLGMGEHEDLNGDFSLHAICDDGKHYSVEPLTSTYVSVNTGLSTSSKPYFFQFQHKLIVCNGENDAYYLNDDGTTITQTTFYNTYNKYPTCGVSFSGRIFLARDNLLAWSAANTLTAWDTTTYEGDAGYKDNFNGKITSLHVFSNYMIIVTTTDIYLLSGSDNTSWNFQHYSDTGVKSKNAVTKIDNKLYLWNNGLFPIEYTGDMAQVRIADALTVLIQNNLIDIDTFRLNEINLVTYPERKQIWAYIPVKNKEGIYRAWIINFESYTKNKTVSCYRREANPVTCACEFRGKIYSATSTGKIYQEDTGNLFDTNPIVSEFKFNPLRLGTQRLKSNYEVIQLIMNAKSVNKFKFTTAYDGDFYDPSEIDVDDITVEDNYYVLNQTEIGVGDASVVNDYVMTTVNILDEWCIIQCGIKTDTAEEDYILEGLIFLDSNDNRDYNG